jgi:hypothetical protein
MLKIVPDPLHNHPPLEDTLIQAANYALYAHSVANQTIPTAQIARVDLDDGDNA